MAPSQLKQLKANLHTKRTSNDPKSKSATGQKSNSAKSAGKTSTFSSSNGKHTTPWQKPRSDPKARADSIRRKTLLPAIQNRHKVGGIVDRRIGENDPTMTPEERMLQRYAKQRSRRDTFNLEADEGEDEDDFLTHGGKSILDLPADKMDDYNLSDDGGEGSDADDGEMMVKKRKRDHEDADPEQRRDEQPERKKSKKEVMEEVIAKSKLHKYERQKAKDEDDDIREELDKGLGDLLAVLRGTPRPPPQAVKPNKPATMEIHPDRIARMNGTSQTKSTEVPAIDLPPTPPEEPVLPSKEPSPSPPPVPNYKQQVEKEYDQRLRQMAMDQRAQPTVRTKTAEEKIAAEAARLKELEAKRVRRMKGEQEDSESEGEELPASDIEEDEEREANEAADFGFQNTPARPKGEYDVEDEDDFVIDDDLVASGSDIDSELSQDSDEDGAETEEEDDDEFLKDVLPGGSKSGKADLESKTSQLPYTYACPQTHEELLKLTHKIPITDLPLVIQRIRALYHPQLNVANKEKLSHFASSLIDHLEYLGSHKPLLPVVEQLIRHIHSLSKTHVDTTAATFRKHLTRMHESNSMTAGDLLILTAVGTVYPTSDHFHQVVTPAITLMGRWLGMTSVRPESPDIDTTLRTGAYLVALTLKYQSYSKRYIPESLRFTTFALSTFPGHPLMPQHIRNLFHMARLWSSKCSFFEMFVPAAYTALKATHDQKAIEYLRIALRQSTLSRRNLELHHHKPLAIPSRIPRFEDNFHPDRHYDPDAERAESARLRKEHKRERKGAVRELRKDADFIAREKYREKKERDAEYAKRQRRIVSEIQAEEGREGNLYEREKRRRKGGR